MTDVEQLDPAGARFLASGPPHSPLPLTSVLPLGDSVMLPSPPWQSSPQNDTRRAETSGFICRGTRS